MSTEKTETLSALMDGETSASETDATVQAVANNDAARHTWFRYHLIREAMQNQLSDPVDTQLAERIRAQLTLEPTILAPQSSLRTYLKPVAGLAIAASVTAAVLLGVQISNKEQGQAETPAFASNSTPQISQPVQFVSGNSQPLNGSPQVQTAESPMNRYLVNYNEYRANSGMRGMLPYVRIIGHETER